MSKPMPTVAGMDKPSPPTLHLHGDHLRHFGLDKLPAVGDEVPISHVGKVISVSDHGEDGGQSVSMELVKMAKAATKKASEQDVEEGKLKGAKAAMDQALDAQEMSKSANKKHGKAVGRKP